jgi:hypothetical protein
MLASPWQKQNIFHALWLNVQQCYQIDMGCIGILPISIPLLSFALMKKVFIHGVQAVVDLFIL